MRAEVVGAVVGIPEAEVTGRLGDDSGQVDF